MPRFVCAVVLSAASVLATGCTSQSSTAPSTPSSSPGRVLTLQRDTDAPVGQSVGVMTASRGQKAGTITVAVAGYNIQNVLGTVSSGFASAEGRLKWNEALLEIDDVGTSDHAGPGELLGTTANCCRQEALTPGIYPFIVSRRDGSLVQGSGELFWLRLRPVSGVTAGSARIDLEPFPVVPGGSSLNNFTTQLLLRPFIGGARGNVMEHVYGAAVEIR